MNQQLLINKNDLADTRWDSGEIPEAKQPGEVVLQVESFALTANNITYAVAGESMQYWQFFPAEDGWGRVPVWGFGRVVMSNHPEIEQGQRYYGYYPVGSHLTVQAENVSARGMVDGAAHRAALAKVYNQYSLAGAPNAQADAAEMLYRPLFMTSFLLADFATNADFFGAVDIILTSASSKTSLGLAFLLNRNPDCRVIGLTSTGNVPFVEGLGCYDEVVTYDQVERLDASKAAMIVDMAGNGSALAAVHNHYQEQLRYSCLVGATHWNARAGAQGMAGPKPELFFAPSHIEKRTKELGPAGFQDSFQGAWEDFLSAAKDWISVRQISGPEGVGQFYKALLNNEVSPAEGVVLSI